jgi:hypothetical protein
MFWLPWVSLDNSHRLYGQFLELASELCEFESESMTRHVLERDIYVMTFGSQKLQLVDVIRQSV